MKRWICLVLALALLPVQAFAAGSAEPNENPYQGKVISVLGDSISTFARQ